MLNPHAAGRGFTMVELLVAMAVIATLLAVGLPTMGTYLQNSKLGSATSTIYSALQTARAEAIRRNAPAEFVLTNTPVDTSDIANALTPSVGGRSWIVRAASGATFTPVEIKAGTEGEGTAAPAIVVAGAASAPATFDGRVVFTSLGASIDSTGTPARVTFDITNPTGGLCVAAGGPIRCRRVVVSPGGQISACDPAAIAGDSRACLP